MSNNVDLTSLFFNYQKEFVNDPSPRKIFLKSRQVGFSFMCAYCCVRKAAMEKDSLSIIISVNQRSAEELLKKVKQWAEALKVATDGMISYDSNAAEVRLSNGSRIISVPGGNPDAARGYTVTGVLALDEFAYIPNIEDLWQSVIPTMTNRIRGIQPEIILGSTPAAKSSLFGRIWFEDPNFKHFQTTIEQAKFDGLPVDIDELHKLVPDPEQFAIEFECKWSDSQGTFIDPSLVDWYDFDGNAVGNYWVGIDFGRHNDSTAISILKQKDGKYFLENIITLQNCEYQKQFNIIQELHNKYHFIGGYSDQNGIGSAIAEQIQKQICSKIRGYSTTVSNKTPNYEYLRSKIFDHQILFNVSYQKDIVQDFQNIQKLISETGKISYVAGHMYGNHSDITSSIVLALQAAKDFPLNAAAPSPYIFNSVFGGYHSRL